VVVLGTNHFGRSSHRAWSLRTGTSQPRGVSWRRTGTSWGASRRRRAAT
jgi:hypothetical protein